MQLQNSVKGDFEGMTFHFAVDTCENFQTYTKSTTCKDNTVVEPMIDDFSVVVKISEEFFSAKTYASNNE